MWNLLLLSSDWSCVTWWDSSILIGCCGWNTSAHWHVSVVDCESLKAPRLWGVLWIHHTASAQMFRPLQSRPQRGSGRSPRWPAMVTQWFPRQPQRSVPRRHQVVVRTSVFFFGLVCLNYFNVEQRWVLKISSLWTFTVLVHSWKLISILPCICCFIRNIKLFFFMNKSDLGKISRFINRSLVVANVIISVDLFLMTWREVSILHDT